MRDLGGFPADGGVIASGKLIRSGRLYKLPQKTLLALKKMNVTNVIDMRIDKEREERPATIIEGAKYAYLPLVCTATPGITSEKTMARTMYEESKRIKEEFGTAENYMRHMYNFILFEPDSMAKLKDIFDILLEAEGCVIFHCNSGKDRTGVVAMLIEGALGCDRQLIIKDYMASRRLQRRRRSLQKAGLLICPVPMRFKKILFAMMRTKEQYIVDMLDEIDKRYGGMKGYLSDGLGISEANLNALKDKYIVKT